MDVVAKWPGRIFHSSLNKMLKDGAVSPCSKHIVPNRDPVPVSLLRNPAYPLLPYVMKEFSGGVKNDRERFFYYKLSSARMVIENAFGQLKGGFGCLKRAMDVDINVLPHVIRTYFVLHNCSEKKKEISKESLTICFFVALYSMCSCPKISRNVFLFIITHIFSTHFAINLFCLHNLKT